MDEIGDVLGCDHSVISRRFAREYARARASWKISLRRAQTIRAIRDRSDALLVHLGKVYLGQSTGGEGDGPGRIDWAAVARRLESHDGAGRDGDAGPGAGGLA